MIVRIPEFSLVVLIGATGSGKSTFARQHFRPTEIVSSDYCRGVVADDENDQSATDDAFEVLHFIVGKRLAGRRLAVVDATNVSEEGRRPLLALARRHDCMAAAIVFNLPEAVCHERNRDRPERAFGPHVARNQTRQMRRSLRGLEKEGFRYLYVFRSVEDVAAASVVRDPLWTDRRHDTGPFDVIGDVHGCGDELERLLETLGYVPSGNGTRAWTHPAGRKALYVGDLVDRGPRIPDVLEIVMDSIEAGGALCVAGNHDVKLSRKLAGRNVQVTHGLAESIQQLEARPAEFRERVARFLDGLIGHFVLDGGKLVVAHAGMKEAFQGRASRRVREFGLYGETTGETDEFGLPIRYNWAAEYRGRARVVYGHTPVPEPEWLNHTINVDTGCVFGGRLTALRYPELELVSVTASRVYYESARPFPIPTGDTLEGVPGSASRTAQQAHDEVLDLADVTGKRYIDTRLAKKILIREDQAAAALEVMSRFAADPRWLIYLPPTMSPCKTSLRPDTLESPEEAFEYFRSEGVARVVCEEKHMGSRAVVVVARSEDAARRRFGTEGQGSGICFTRTGRPFFDDAEVHAAFLSRLQQALGAADFWEALQTEWACLDCELMPWSAKAQSLIREQYAAVGAAATASLGHAATLLQQVAGADDLQSRTASRLQDVERYVAAYKRYCWPVAGVADLRLAPFHILATEGHAHTSRDHAWHMAMLAEVCAQDPGWLVATPYRIVDLTDPASQEDAVGWWEEMTARGGEGMVVKPLDFVAQGRHGLVQPALKVRGREYLRIIYGPEYTEPANLDRLRERGLGRKRALASREFALGVESLERFVRREPLRRVHECVFGVLALETEPVDPRL